MAISFIVSLCLLHQVAAIADKSENARFFVVANGYDTPNAEVWDVGVSEECKSLKKQTIFCSRTRTLSARTRSQAAPLSRMSVGSHGDHRPMTMWHWFVDILADRTEISLSGIAKKWRLCPVAISHRLLQQRSHVA